MTPTAPRYRAARRVGFLALLGLAASCGHDPVGPAPVASVVVQPDSVSLVVGETRQLEASARDAGGSTLSGRAVTWTTGDLAIATVSETGLITALSYGRVGIRATSEGKTGVAIVIVGEPGPQDFSITGAQFTQGVQAPNGSVPLILSGGAAVVNVLIRARQPTATPMQLLLRLFNGAGALVRADTVRASGPFPAGPSYAAPGAQFLVPASALQAGLEWQVVRDPRNAVPDDSAGNDVFPRAGRATVGAISVPTLKLRFVPIVLAAHLNAKGDVSAANLTEYLQTVRSAEPIGPISTTIGTSFTTSLSFGTPPSGGESGFWQQLLSELDLARIADASDPETHWYGVVRPPAGFNYTAYGGYAYIPSSGQSTGAGTRTAVGVQVGWFNRPTQARDLVAHELAHNFGRRHAPCGGAPGTDPDFPYAGGKIGVPGHDVYSWAQGFAASAAVIDDQTGDVMGYCFPVWLSEYTYRGILQFRVPPTASPPQIASVLIVRGSIEAGRGIRLEPAFVLDARPTLPERRGDYHLRGLAQDGRVLFSHDFEPAVIDHAPNTRHFAFAIPAEPALAAALVTLEVRGPAGEARVSRPATGPRAVAPGLVASVARDRGGLVRVACRDGSARGILVRDGRAGAVLATSAGPSLLAYVRSGTPLVVACSDGIGTTRGLGVAP